MGLVLRWIDTAVERGAREPRSLALATADARGRASNRVITFSRASADGLLFTTHAGSRKGREIDATGWGSALFYWRELGRQVMLSGPVDRLDDSVADELWRARPTPLHAMSTASSQSDPLPDPGALRADALRLGESGRPLPRPAGFAGYLLRPADVEFWNASSDRMHRRLSYVHGPDGWLTRRLQP
ncbi:pyridoxal 5'-phosphate synthase [Streptomyces triticagri]|uniref:Pyridoxal 5'-phosphate synthase n=2 Tax=Streptomyces triticagri TaxID=2293568 RepID=A0A372M8G0_9ACTN|nr:pyridoxal 5'-phosphate synthase [Streptomyces triticagri]